MRPAAAAWCACASPRPCSAGTGTRVCVLRSSSIRHTVAFDAGALMRGMPPTPHRDAARSERTAARRRIVAITQATAAAAALTTAAVAVLASTTAAQATGAVSPVSGSSSSSTTLPDASPDDGSAGALAAAPSAPQPTDQTPVASSGGS